MSLIKTAAWMLFGRWAFYFVTLISFSLIIRFVTPGDYGVYVIASTFLIFADVFFADAVENAVVRQEGEKGLVASVAFWVVLGFSCAISIFLALIAYPLGAAYDQDALPVLMLGIAVVVFVQGLASVPRALLLKEGRAKNYSLYSGACNLIGAVVGVSAAYRGYGAWSFVLQQGVLQLSMLVLCSFSAGFFPRFVFSGDMAREIFGFVKTSFWSCVLNVLANRLDIVFLGFYFDTAVVGVYGLAKRLIQILQELVGSSFDKALVSFKAKKLKTAELAAYRQSVVAQALVLFPAFIGFSILGSNLVGLLFGFKWVEASPLVSLMALGGIFRSMVTIERAELVVKGLAGTILRIRFVELIIGFALVAPFAHLGAEWMAIGFTLRYIIGYLLVVWSRFPVRAEFLLQVKTTCIWLYPVATASACMAICGFGANLLAARMFGDWVVVGLIACCVLCAAAYVLVVYLQRRRLLPLLKGV